MGTFAAMLGPYHKSCESCDYGNIPIDLPFQIWYAVEFSSPILLLVPFALSNLFTLHIISISGFLISVLVSIPMIIRTIN